MENKKLKNKKNRLLTGFTIIELIVVIAIIAILAGIVLVNVTQYIAKSKDASIKGNMSSAQTASAIYYEANPGGAAPCLDTTSGFKTLYDAVSLTSGAESCADAANVWCMCAQLVTDTAKYYCIDSTGKKAETSAACSADCDDTGADYICNGS